jgi:hypothetical protein
MHHIIEGFIKIVYFYVLCCKTLLSYLALEKPVLVSPILEVIAHEKCNVDVVLHRLTLAGCRKGSGSSHTSLPPCVSCYNV